MAQGYKIREHDLGVANMRALVLMSETASLDFLEKKNDRKKEKREFELIIKVMQRIQYRGVDKCGPALVKTLDGELCLVEIKIMNSVIRLMAYEHDRGKPSAELVLLFDFKGHQGSNKIPPEIMKRAKKLARIAKETMEE